MSRGTANRLRRAAAVLALLVPFAVALWMRIKSTQVRGSPRGKGDL